MPDQNRVPPIRDTSDLRLGLSLNQFTEIIREAINFTITELKDSNSRDSVTLESDRVEQAKHLTLIRTQFACFQNDAKFIKVLVFIHILSGITALWMCLSTFEPKEITTLTFAEADYAALNSVIWDGMTTDITNQAEKWEEKFPLVKELAEAERKVLGTRRVTDAMEGSSPGKVDIRDASKNSKTGKSLGSRLLQMAGRKSSDRLPNTKFHADRKGS